MENYINLDNLPRKFGKIDWKNCDNNLVTFSYRGVQDFFIVVKHIDQDYVLVNYKDKEYKISKVCIMTCALGKLFNFANPGNFKYVTNDIINVKTGQLKVLKQFRDARKSKAYEVQCLTCNGKFNIREGNLNKGDACTYCTNHSVLVGFNDMWTTCPEVAENLTNPEDGYKYHKQSNKKVDFTCKQCGTHIGLKSIYNTTKQGLSCPGCGDGVSYPNKFIYHLLTELNEDFDNEVIFDWCKFKAYNSDGITHGVYDAVVENKKLIIEMDSSLGHGRGTYTNSKVKPEEYLYRDTEKDRLANEHGYKIIRVDCQYGYVANRFSACKNGILSSELSSIYDLSNIDWNKIHKGALSSFIVNACNLYNEGYSVSQISKSIKRHSNTIVNYLKLGKQCGLCVYN